MNKVIIFIALKVVELSLLVFVPYYGALAIYSLGWVERADYVDTAREVWMDGVVLCIFIPIAIVGVGLIIGLALSLNWELAGRFMKRLTGRTK